MEYLEHIRALKEKLKNPVKGIPISFPTFRKYYPYFEKGHRILLAADTGTTKAQPNSAVIYTPEGYKTMGEIQVGDYVITKSGEPTEVLEIYPFDNLDIYKITFSDGTSTECCEDHLWEVRARSKNKYDIRSTKELLKLKLIGKTPKNNIRYEYTVDLCEEVQHTQKNLSIKPYLLGYLLGNGCFGHVTSIVSHINDLEEIITYLNLTNHFTFTRQKFQPTLPNNARINISNKIKPILDNLNLLGKKSQNKFIPEEYFYSTIEDRYDLLAGLLDSDGSINDSGHKCKIRYSSTSKQLALDIQKLVRSLGGICTIVECTSDQYKNNVIYNCSIRTRKNPFKLKRKSDVFDKVGGFSYFFRKGIANIDYVGKKNSKCILVKDSSHLYLTDDYTVTHNTTLTIKCFILDIIAYCVNNPTVSAKIYYFSIENHRSVVISKFYLYLIAKYLGREYTLTELMNPSQQQTIDDIEAMTPKMEKIKQSLVIIDSIHAPTEIYQYMIKEMEQYGKLTTNSKGERTFTYFNPEQYVFCITDTINALNPDPGLSEYDSIKRWSKNYCKLGLSNIYSTIVINISQLDNSVRANMYANTGQRVEEKHEPTLGQLADVKSTPADHTLVMSLFLPYRYGINTYMDYDIKRLDNHYIRLSIIKNNFGLAGREVGAHLYFDGNKGDYEELPDAADKAAVDAFLDKKGIGKLVANSGAKKVDKFLI
jgi:hypothetical protein